MNESTHPIDVDSAVQLLPGVKRKTVSWTLWDLARKDEIQKIGNLYASLNFSPAISPATQLMAQFVETVRGADDRLARGPGERERFGLGSLENVDLG
ncbi:MAG TPA: hypothetical protein VIL92_07260 [Gaiellaceae bacterium]